MKVLFPTKPAAVPPPPPVVEEVAPLPLAPVERSPLDILVDVSYLSYRSAHAYWDLTHQGVHTGHVYGSFLALLTLHKEYYPSYDLRFIFATDGEPVWRKSQYEDYKAGRLKTLGYDPRHDVVRMLSLVPGIIASNEDEEADDVIASYIRKTSKENPDRRFVVLSSDKDLWALRDEKNVTIIGNKMHKVTDEELLDSFFTKNPVFIPLSKAIIGDEGDNLPKVMRFPRKDLALIFENTGYPDVDSMFAAADKLVVAGKIAERSSKLLRENEAQIRKTYSLATLRNAIWFNEYKTDSSKESLVAFLKSFGCNSLLPRVDSLYRSYP